MKLTKSQRYTAYVIGLYEIEVDIDENAFCVTLFARLLGLQEAAFHYYENAEHIFPELHKKRTTSRKWIVWFNTHKERIAALKECIEELEPYV